MNADSCRQYGRDDVDYATWYTPWMKQLAAGHTRDVAIAALMDMLRLADERAAARAAVRTSRVAACTPEPIL